MRVRMLYFPNAVSHISCSFIFVYSTLSGPETTYCKSRRGGTPSDWCGEEVSFWNTTPFWTIPSNEWWTYKKTIKLRPVLWLSWDVGIWIIVLNNWPTHVPCLATVFGSCILNHLNWISSRKICGHLTRTMGSYHRSILMLGIFNRMIPYKRTWTS